MEDNLRKNEKGYYARKKAQMSDNERVRDFQRKLYQKAKQNKTFRFYSLYDKLYVYYVLREAYRRCRANNGAPGIDGLTFDDIEKEGLIPFLNNIQEELRTKTYRPQPVKRKYISKANGKLRPLGIPTIKDRVIQMACKMFIEPIFEADFENESYGFRPKRDAGGAVRQIKENLKNGLTEVLDADLSSYFDTIPHKELLILLGKRISDRHVLHLIKMWLKTPISEKGKLSGGKKSKRGTPQGGVISPLLANIYLNTLDKAVNRKDGIFKRMGIKIVRYADDFVLMGRTISADAEWYLQGLMKRFKLEINTQKTNKVDAKEKAFDFLGFTFRFDKDLFGQEKKYWNVEPSKKSLKKFSVKFSERLKEIRHYGKRDLVKELNMLLRGWLNYFEIPKVSYPAKINRRLRWYIMMKLYRYYKRKSQRRCKLYNQGAFNILVKRYGLINPATYRRSVNA